MNSTETSETKRSLWERILALLEKDLAERRDGKVFVEVLEESGPYRKEIGELSGAEMRGLEPRLRIHVVNQLLERYLAEQGLVDLLNGRHLYTKDIRDLTCGPDSPHTSRMGKGRGAAGGAREGRVRPRGA